MIFTTVPVLYLDVPKIAQSGTDQSGILKEVEKSLIIKALNTTGWRLSGKAGAAEFLGVNPKTLESMMKKTENPKKQEECLIYQESPDISEVFTFQGIIP